MSIRRTVPVEQAEWTLAPPPAWRIARDIDWGWRAPAGHGVAYLLIDEQHDVASQACSRRSVRQLLSISAVQALGQVELEFDPAAQRLCVHELVVWRHDPDGTWRRRTPVAREAFLLRQREQQLEQQMLNGRVSLVALMEDVRIGDVIDLAWTLEPRDPLPGLAFTSYYAFAWQSAVARAQFTLHLDSRHPVRWRVNVPDGTAAPREQAGAQTITWDIGQPPPFEAEANVPGHHWPWPLLEVTGWESWAQVARFFNDWWADALLEDAAAIAAEATLLNAGDRAAAIAAAVRFVQEDVRYLAVDFGHGAGMLPNGAGTVLRRRFGDCKDKAVLLTALLRALGVLAHPVLVAATWRESLARLLPSPNAFDHAIVSFVVDGVRHFVDPTCIGQRGDLANFVAPDFAFGLELARDTAALLSLPARPPAGLSLTETFELDRKRPGRVVQVLRADAWLADDLRATLLRQGRQAFLKGRAESLQQHFPALVPNFDQAVVDDDPQGNVVSIASEHALSTWGSVGDKPPSFFRYGAYGLLLGLDTVDEREQRQQPWALRYPMRVQHRVVVRGRCVHKVKPSTFDHTGPGFRYRCEVRSKRHEVSFDYVWETTAAIVTAHEWPDYRTARATALEQTGALVNTQGMTFGRALRIGIGCFLGVVWGTHLLLRLADDRPLQSGKEAQAAMMRDVGDAFEAMRRGDATRAYALAAPYARHYEDNFEAQILLAESSMLTGHADEARDALARARSLKPDHGLPDVVEANMLERDGDFAGARRLLEAAVVRKDIDAKAFLDLARVTERTHDPVAARAAWERLLQRQPAHPEGLYGLAHLLWLDGERTRADELIVGAVRSQPTPSAVLEGALARYYASTGRQAEALDAARRAAELAPDDVAAARQFTMAQMNIGERAGAVASARQMTQRFADNPLAWSALAITAAVAGEHGVAAPAFERWTALAPNDPEAVSGYGYFLHLQGDDTQARGVLADGTGRFPAYGNLWLNYAVVLEALGDPAAADARRKADALMTPEQRATLAR